MGYAQPQKIEGTSVHDLLADDNLYTHHTPIANPYTRIDVLGLGVFSLGIFCLGVLSGCVRSGCVRSEYANWPFMVE